MGLPATSAVRLGLRASCIKRSPVRSRASTAWRREFSVESSPIGGRYSYQLPAAPSLPLSTTRRALTPRGGRQRGPPWAARRAGTRSARRAVTSIAARTGRSTASSNPGTRRGAPGSAPPTRAEPQDAHHEAAEHGRQRPPRDVEDHGVRGGLRGRCSPQLVRALADDVKNAKRPMAARASRSWRTHRAATPDTRRPSRRGCPRSIAGIDWRD